MPSPFPGVDPFIEAQGYWEGFHGRFVPYCGDALNEILPEHYVADVCERLYLVDVASEGSKKTVPDVLITRHPPRSRTASRRGRGLAGTALIEPVRNWLPPDQVEIRSVWVEIRRPPNRTPVTVIEVLSPTNKAGEGFSEYLQKRRATIGQKVHLVELDLLLKGERLPMQRPLPPGDFYAFVSRADKRPQSDVYAWTIRDPLPAIPIPILRPDPDVVLDLAAVAATTYERARFARSLDYGIPPTTVKKAADRAWAERTARAARR